jgi:P27 family predicted phage terminase small subunit
MPNPKKTRRERIADGNPSGRPLPGTVQAPSGKPKMPDYLGPVARAEWRRVTGILDRMGILSVLDRASLADYCTVVERLQEASTAITKEGLLVKGERGMVKNPACQLERQYRQALLSYCSLFGLAPSPRGRMELPDAGDDYDGFLDDPLPSPSRRSKANSEDHEPLLDDPV